MRIGSTVLAASCLALIVAAGCSKAPASTGAAESTVQGTLALSSFPAAIQKVTAVDKNGQKTRFDVAPDGTFSVTLPAGSTYHLFLSDDAQSLPVLLSTKSGKLATLLSVKSGGAKVDLGKVQYFAGGSKAAIPAMSVAAEICDGETADDGQPDGETADDSGADCVDGIDAASGQSCDGGPAANGNDGAGDGSGDASDGEGDEVDGSEPMGVPENGVDGDVGCNDGSDDGEEQD